MLTVADGLALAEPINASGSTNFALASNGGVASASSTYTAARYNFVASSVNGVKLTSLNWSYGGGRNDATAGAYPDWVEIDFNATQTIDYVVVYTVQDNYASPAPPTDTMTFSLDGVTNFTVQGWNGSAWVTLGTVSGNNLVKRIVQLRRLHHDQDPDQHHGRPRFLLSSYRSRGLGQLVFNCVS